MIKASMLIMAVLTVIIAMGLRWREQRMPEVAKQKRLGVIARGKKGLDRW
jgi:preprotein translocase subunit YajC